MVQYFTYNQYNAFTIKSNSKNRMCAWVYFFLAKRWALMIAYVVLPCMCLREPQCRQLVLPVLSLGRVWVHCSQDIHPLTWHTTHGGNGQVEHIIILTKVMMIINCLPYYRVMAALNFLRYLLIRDTQERNKVSESVCQCLLSTMSIL